MFDSFRYDKRNFGRGGQCTGLKSGNQCSTPRGSTFGSLAQSAEHETFNFGVDGSNPSRITNIDVVQLVECGVWDAVVAGSSPDIYT